MLASAWSRRLLQAFLLIIFQSVVEEIDLTEIKEVDLGAEECRTESQFYRNYYELRNTKPRLENWELLIAPRNNDERLHDKPRRRFRALSLNSMAVLNMSISFRLETGFRRV